MTCDICGPDDKRETRQSRSIGRSPSEAVSCHRLECGHQWHRTTTIASANAVPGVMPQVPAPRECDCADYVPPKATN